VLFRECIHLLQFQQTGWVGMDGMSQGGKKRDDDEAHSHF